MTEHTLLPCPFCGGKAAIIQDEDVYTGDAIDSFQIYCTSCFVSRVWCSTTTKTIEGWNTRTQPPADPDLLEVLKEIIVKFSTEKIAYNWSPSKVCTSCEATIPIKAVAKHHAGCLWEKARAAIAKATGGEG